MNDDRVKILQEKLLRLADELARLEAIRDGIIQDRIAATTSEERRKCSGAAGAVYPQISEVRHRISHARRLLAHAQGDEYQAGSQ